VTVKLQVASYHGSKSAQEEEEEEEGDIGLYHISGRVCGCSAVWVWSMMLFVHHGDKISPLLLSSCPLISDELSWNVCLSCHLCHSHLCHSHSATPQ